MANTMKALQTVTVGAGGAASIEFTNIPQTYTDLVVKLCARGTNAAVAISPILYFNNDTSAGSFKSLVGNGSAASSSGTSGYIDAGVIPSANATSSTFSNFELYIPNYVGNTNKSVSSDSVTENNATEAYANLRALLWSNTVAITSIKFTLGAGNYAQYSTATLYGVFNQDVIAAPAAPTIGTASDGGTGTSASVAFTGVSGAASYTATSSPGGFTGTAAASPVTVTGLTTGTAYTFTVKANNPIGSSAASAASNSVTPAAPGVFESIASITASGSSATASFTSIPSTYKHLQIRASFSAAATSGSLFVQVNGDTGSNYARHNLSGDGSAAYGRASTSTGYPSLNTNYNLSATYPSFVVVDLIDYADTSKTKTIRAVYGLDINSSASEIDLNSVLWNSTSAINRVDIFAGTNFTSGSTFALYGIKG